MVKKHIPGLFHFRCKVLTHFTGTLKKLIISPEKQDNNDREAGTPMFNPFKKDQAVEAQDPDQEVQPENMPEDVSEPETEPVDDEAPAANPSLPSRLGGWAGRHKKLCIAAVVVVAAAGILTWRMRSVPAMADSEYQYVRTTTLQKGSLNDSVTVTGTVVSGDEANVTVSDSVKTYKVATVEAEVGDTVQEGDVIATLDTTDLEKQIEDAQQSYNDNLQAAQTSYDRAVDDYNTSVVQHDNNLIDLQAKIDQADEAQADAEEALEKAKSDRDAAQSTYNAAISDYNSLVSDFNMVKAQIDSYTSAYNSASDALNAALSALNSANNAVTAALGEQQSAQSAYNADPSDANKLALDTANSKVEAATATQKTAQTTYDSAQAAATKAQQDLSNAQSSCSVTSRGLYGYAAIEQAVNAAEQAKTSAETAYNQAQNQVSTAETQVETAEQQVKSAHDSYDNEKNYSNIKTKAQAVEDAKTKLDQAKRIPDNLETLQDSLADCTLTATMSGTITALDATVGSVCAGTVATIQDTDALVVEVTIPADDVPGLETGMSCLITSDATGDTQIAGTLTQIDPVANDQGTFGAKVRVTGEAEDLLIGIQAQAEIIKSQVTDVYVVPIDAVGTAEDGTQYVLRKTGGEGVDMTFEQVTVTTGDSNDYYTTISGTDLQEGDVIRSSADLTQGIVTATDPTEQMMMAMNGDTGAAGGPAPEEDAPADMDRGGGAAPAGDAGSMAGGM